MRTIALFEIFILIAAGFAFSYFIHESSGLLNAGAEEEKGIRFLREKILGYLSKGLVSAQEGLWTCIENVNGTLCQEYPSEICKPESEGGICTSQCIPSRRENTQECKLGTCFNPAEGTCAAQSPKFACESSNGVWSEQEPAQCTPGCCLIGGNANYIPQQACNVLENRLGIEGEWQEVGNELECLVLGQQQEEGACVLGEAEPGLFDCKFTSKAECLSRGGEFNSGLLCTNPGLNTICQRTKETSCFSDKDEVYFIDTCGNKANIYDTNKKSNDDYWARVFKKNETCSLDGDLGNQEACGNCDYITGTLCGTPGEDDEQPLDGEYVCRDLSCVDEWGDERKNGESWCAFDSQIGIDNDGEGNKGRSVDLPGSRHYRQVCSDGEVRTEACADFRNEICQESRDDEIGFSSAACRINRWQQCIEANTDKEKLNTCETNSDCFLKEVRIDEFKFDVCAPKYPSGFDLGAEFGGEVGQTICSMGSQKCIVIQSKGVGGWTTEVNEGCLKPEFAQTMNNLCISLGDCGGNVNVEGVYTDAGYSVKKSPKIGKNSNYVSELQAYTEAVKGQHADPLTKEEAAALFGLDPNDPEIDDKMASIIGGIGAGSLGILLAYGALIYSGGITGALGAISQFGIVEGLFAVGQQGTFALGTWSSVAGAAAAGAAIGFLIGKLFGLEGDGLLAATIAGVFAGVISQTGLFGVFGGNALFSAGFFIWTIIIVIIIVIIIKLLGIGDTRTIKIVFTCNPWQPPLGGADCEKCTEGDLPCSEYKCQSLGQACDFINEGTGEEACIDTAPDDVSAPIISPNYEAISDGFEYSEVTDRSFKIEHSELECIPAYTQLTWGISLNEFAQCKYDTEHTGDYEEMEFYFGESSLFKKDHVTALALPSLESLGEGGFDPERRADFTLYARCQDKNGNGHDAAEFAVGFCVSPENDITPPILQNFEPENPAYVSLEATELNLTFFTNEPAECRYSLTDSDYDAMQGNVGCSNNVSDMTLFGFECNTLLPAIGNETQYYLRCKDKPWAVEEERNVNSQSINYTIIKTSEPLIIEEIKVIPEPEDGIISSGAEPVSVSLEVKTSGGAPVETYCTYGFGGSNDLARFFESGGDLHKQTFSSLFEGNYNLGVRCEDAAGNAAEGSVQFTIEVDEEGPAITRIYTQGSNLNVITNEDSACYYSHNSCGFPIPGEDVFEMSGSGLTHTADFNPQINYYIKCQDSWNNVGMCTTVRAGY